MGRIGHLYVEVGLGAVARVAAGGKLLSCGDELAGAHLNAVTAKMSQEDERASG
ncbi:MAG TPA: hypothetical protein VES40_11180 [Ilumatobacteraceae bacterium]|nr:hypothetical protein [Ilumatobacteraceae bacterium]